jgi:hypothetical protein
VLLLLLLLVLLVLLVLVPVLPAVQLLGQEVHGGWVRAGLQLHER